MNKRRSAKAEMDAMRRKGTTLLRDWGQCPECRERGTLTVSVPVSGGTLVVVITCARNRCGLRRPFPSSYLQQLGSIADGVRSWLEDREVRRQAEARDRAERTAADIIRENMGEVLREKAEEDENRFFGFSWDDMFGRRG